MAEPSLLNQAKPQAKAFLKDLPNYAVSETVSDIKQRYQLDEVAYLASNENPFGCSPAVRAALSDALDVSHRYPDGAGLDLKATLSRSLKLHTRQILLGNGSNEILDCVIKAFLGPGDELLVSAHSFAMYPIMAQWVGAQVRQVPMRDWTVDLDAVSAAVSPRTRLILLANANNPTGTMVSAAELDDFLATIPSEVLVLIDEAYIEFADPEYGQAISHLERYPNLFVCRTFSKAYGLAGFRIGYGLGHADVIEVLEKIRQPFNVNGLALKAAAAAYEDQTFLEDCLVSNRQERTRIEAFLTNYGLTPLPSQANFVAFRVQDGMTEMYQALLQQGVIVRRLNSYAMPDWVRVSVGTPSENSWFIRALEAFLESRHANQA